MPINLTFIMGMMFTHSILTLTQGITTIMAIQTTTTMTGVTSILIGVINRFAAFLSGQVKDKKGLK